MRCSFFSTCLISDTKQKQHCVPPKIRPEEALKFLLLSLECSQLKTQMLGYKETQAAMAYKMNN